MSTKALEPKRRGGNKDKLTVQQQVFVEAFFADKKMSVTNAATKAGYSSPAAAGHKLMNQPNVKAIIQKRLNEIRWEHRADRERVLNELMSISFSSPQDLLKEDGSVFSLKEMPPQVARSIRKLSISYSEEEQEDGTFITVKNVTVDFWDKMYALDLLMKHLGMMEPIKHEVTHTVDWDSMVVPHANAVTDDYDPVEAEIRSITHTITDDLPGDSSPRKKAGVVVKKVANE